MKRRAILLLAIGLSLLVPAACNFGTAPGGTEGEGLTGVLVNPSGSPVSNIAVRVYPVTSGSSARASTVLNKGAVAFAGGQSDSAYTQFDGRFSFTQLSNGTTYNLNASFKRNDSLFSVFIQNIAYKGGRMDLGRATLVVSGGLTLHVTLDGTTGSDSVVCRIAASPFVDTANGSGACVLEGLPPGNFQIEISRPGYRTIVTDALTVIKGLLSEGGLLDLDPLTEPPPPNGQHFELESSTVALWTFNRYAAGSSPYGFEDVGPKKIRLNSSAGRLPLVTSLTDSAVKLSGTTCLTAAADSIYDPNRTGSLTLEARIYLTKYPSASNTGKRGQVIGLMGGVKLFIGSDGSLQASGLETSPMEAPSYSYPRTAAGVVPLDRWVDVAVSVDAVANQLYAYVNGQPVQLVWPVNSFQIIGTGGAFTLNSLNVGNVVYSGEAFAGNIDEIRISNKAILGPGLPLKFEKDTVVETPVTDPNLVARYDFEEGSGTSLHDRTGNGHDGTIQSGSWVAGVQGNALEFNGSSTKVSIPFKADLNMSEFTLSAWIRSTRTVGQAVISRQTASGSSATWNYRLATTSAATYGSLVVPAGHLLVDFNPVDLQLNNSPISKVSVVDSVWHQVTGVFGGGILKVYVDGVLDTTAVAGDSPDLTSLQPLLLGASAFSDGAYFKGTMDEVRIYKKALTSQQIDSLYRSDKGLSLSGSTHFAKTSSTIALWTFDEKTGGAFADVSGNSRNLTAPSAVSLSTSPTGSAISMNGALVTSSEPSLRIAGNQAITYEVRIRLSEYPSYSNLNRQAHLIGNYGGLSLYVGAGGWIQAVAQKGTDPNWKWHGGNTDAGAVPLNEWVDVAVAADKTTTKIYAYINGQPVMLYNPASDPGGTTLRSYTDTPFALGGSSVDNQPFNGMIDEVRVSSGLVLGAGPEMTIAANMNPDPVRIFPTVPSLLSPAQGATVTSPVTLTWSAVTDAGLYVVDVAKDSSFTQTVFRDSLVAQTSRSVSGLPSGSAYYWRVRARNGAGTSAYSAVKRFLK